MINTGTLTAPEGTTTIAAVPGENLVRLSQQGSLLSLEFSPLSPTLPLSDSPTPPSLPQLLTGGNLGNVTGISVNPDGTMRLTSSGAQIPNEAGVAVVSGTLNTAGQTGGNVNVLGNKVGLVTANIDASGINGGGTVRIGGDYQGKGTIPNASQTFVSSDSVINANALSNGNGGNVIVWADNTTRFYGTVNARGGTQSGNGGFVEISGKENLAFQGNVNVSASNGTVGTVLFDPQDITIVPGVGANDAQVVTDGAVLFGDGGAADFQIGAATLSAIAGNIVLQATNDIIFNAPINNQNLGVGLTAQANNNISISAAANINTTGGNIALIADADNVGGGVLGITNSTITTNGGNFTGSGRGNAITATGVNIVGSTIDVGNGNINLTGTGGTTANSNLGVASTSVIRATGTGTITINGTGGVSNVAATQTRDFGVGVSGLVSVENGQLSITGQGGLSPGGYNHGIAIAGESIRSTGTGRITLNGRGGGANNTGTNYGIALGFDGLPGPVGPEVIHIQSVNGAIELTGVGGVGNGDGNGGIFFYSDSAIASTGSGDITLDGTASTNYGIQLGLEAGANIRSVDGNIKLTGRGINGSAGILIFNGSVSGNGSVVESTGKGNISIEGVGDTVAGVFIGNSAAQNPEGSQIRAANGNLSIIGTIAGAGEGIRINNATLEAPKGTLSLVGTNSTTGIDIALADRTFINPSAPGTGTLSISAPRTSVGNISIQVGTLDLPNTNLIGTTADINLTAPQGIAIGNITNPGRAITLTSQDGSITTANLNSSSTTGDGGAITLIARKSVTTGLLDSSSTVGNGGNVFIDPIADVQVFGINAQGGNAGRGGNVDITAGQFFRAVGTFIDRNNLPASISTAGGLGGGDIVIRHGGGLFNTPFIIGNASINGTAGALSSGAFTLAPPQSFLGSYILGNIQILTTFPAPLPVLPTPLQPLLPQTPILSLPPFNKDSQSPVLSQPVTLLIADDPSTLDPGVGSVEGNWTREFQQYFNPPASDSDTSPSGNENSQNSGSRSTDSGVGVASPLENRSSNNSVGSRSSNPETNDSTNPDSRSTNPDNQPALASGSSSVSNSGSGNSNNQNSDRSPKTLAEIRDQLRKIEQATGAKPALIYAVFVPAASGIEPAKAKEIVPEPLIHSTQSSELPPELLSLSQTQAQPTHLLSNAGHLELFLVTAKGSVVLKSVFGARPDMVLAIANTFRKEVVKPSGNYLASGQQLYQWLVKPLESELQARKINNLVFLADVGLRSLPFAALHDGKKFLVETYSLGLMPTLSLTDTRYVPIKETQVLAMGQSQFADPTLAALPATTFETSTIAQTLWRGRSFQNEGFTLENLRSQRQRQPFGIIHLATHAKFEPGEIQNSFIQLWDAKLQLNQINKLGWNNPSVELAVLSACQTALGDEKAELGFAGFAVQAGVKSALASLWYVDDGGTLGLMTEFYQQLKTAPIKAEALKKAQLAMLRKQVRLEKGQLHWTGGVLTLPPELQELSNSNLSDPYYWSGFTMIGSPW